MRSFTTIDLQYAHRFYGFKGEAQYLHGHTGVLTIEVEDTIENGVNMVFLATRSRRLRGRFYKTLTMRLFCVRMILCSLQFSMFTKRRVSRTDHQPISRRDLLLKLNLQPHTPSADWLLPKRQ